MASLQSYPGKGKDADKTFYRIQPYVIDDNGDRKRITIRLGIGRKRAEQACKAISDLIDCRSANGACGDETDKVEPSAKTKSWVAKVADETICNLLLCYRLIDELPARYAGEMAAVTMESLTEAYIAEFSTGKAPRTITAYRQSQSELLKYFGSRNVDSITASDARKFFNWMIEKRGLAQNTAKVRLRNAKTMFDVAVESEVLSKNPLRAKGLSTTQSAAVKEYVPTATIAKVMEHCPSLEWKVFFQLVRTVPMRIPSEIQELTWNDIDVEANTILVHSPKTRHIGKHARLVRIFGHLQKPLNDLYHQDDDEDAVYVFPNIRKLSNAGKLAGDYVVRAKVKRWPNFFNSLRASAETDLMDEYGLRRACQWSGNSPATAMKNYALVKHTDFADSGVTKLDAKSDALNPFDAEYDAESASLSEQSTRQNKEKGACSSLPDTQQAPLKVPDGLEPSIVCL